MKIAIVSCVAPPEPVVAGRVNWDIAIKFAQEGHQVILITPHPSRPLGKKYSSNNKCIDIVVVNENLKHIQLNSFIYPKYNILLRSFESWDLGFKAIKYINRNLKDIDIIYATPWPFLGQYAFVKFQKCKNIPIIMNVQDLYPESLFTKINSKFFTSFLKPLYQIDRVIAKRSAHITVVSENLKKIYIENRGILDDKITVIENWQDEAEFLKRNGDYQTIIEKYQLPSADNKFIFMYLGNIGPVAGVEKIIQEFNLLDSSRYVLVIAGSGSSKESCVTLANNLKLTNTYFIDVPPGLKSVVELQSIADVLLLPINPSASISSIPSKLIAYMFSAKPIITSATRKSDTGQVVFNSKCGWLVDENQSWHSLMKMASNNSKEDLIKIGSNGFAYAIDNYSKTRGLKKIEMLINKMYKK